MDDVHKKQKQKFDGLFFFLGGGVGGGSFLRQVICLGYAE